jgi:histidinol-phosphatase (PHP family)
MKPSSLHVHTVFCDGKNTAEEMVLAGIESGMETLGFSAHAAWPFSSIWHLHPGRYGEYTAEIGRLKTLYNSRIRILCGFEADWIQGVTAPDRGAYAQFSPDYLIGSVHYVFGPGTKKHDSRPTLWSVDASRDEVAKGIEECFRGDGKRAATAYWGAVRDMVSSCDFDIIGHLDVLRKCNGALHFFDENASWYKRELDLTVKAVAASGKIAEINTGAIGRKTMDDVYPSKDLLSRLAKRDVPIMINSDSHSTKDLLCAFDRARDAALGAGYSTTTVWDSGEWKQVRL